MHCKFFKNILYSVFFISFTAIISCVIMQDKPSTRTMQSVELSPEDDMYTKEVQPIFNQRCVACHSCLESPCQLNLQSYEGIQRGAIRNSLVYNGTRIKEAKLTRLFEDAHRLTDWRAMGFYDVIGKTSDSILLQSLKMGFVDRMAPEDEVKENQYCADNLKDFSIVRNADRKMAMPYGLPPISTKNMQTISDWVAAGAPGPKEIVTLLTPEMSAATTAWEKFLNQKDGKSKLVARYLYEHLFLADFYLESNPRYFLKLIRSSTSCEEEVKIIATRRPNDSPGIDNWYYCFIRAQGVTVDKNHIPYSLSPSKLAWIKKNFMDIDWSAPKGPMNFSDEAAGNPFVTFKAIPEIARYKFLLEDSLYHIATFIKGPVCNGTNAVNSIQEQFYTFFIDPKSDLMALSSEYSKQVIDQLILPGKWGSEVEVTKMASDYHELISNRNLYRKKRGEQLQKFRPHGLTLDDIWDGYGNNENAVLTIMRHGGSARVVKGAFGDLSKTAFVIDYSLFERLVYNLVVNFDVYGNIGHQFLTRVYMDLIRMEAENNFLDFLPSDARLKIKKTWYQGFITTHKLNLFEENQFSRIPAGIKFAKDGDSQLDLVRGILFQRMNPKVRGPVDTINWKKLKSVANQNSEEKELARLSGVEGYFNRHFPEFAFLVITEDGVPQRTYSVVHNRQLKNVSWIMMESMRLDTNRDTLMIGKGYYGSYPNQIFAVESSELPKMIDEILKVFDQSNYNNIVNKYGLLRLDPRIWKIYDFLVQDYVTTDPVNGGYLDLSRYSLQ
jgi:predicted metallopeptidase